MSEKNLYEMWRDKELPGNWNEHLTVKRFEGEELAFHLGFIVGCNVDEIALERGIFDKWHDVETLKSNRLYMADYECEGDIEKVIGYYIEKDKMFYGSVFYLYKGRMVNDATMSFNEEQIKAELKNIREIWNGR